MLIFAALRIALNVGDSRNLFAVATIILLFAATAVSWELLIKISKAPLWEACQRLRLRGELYRAGCDYGVVSRSAKIAMGMRVDGVAEGPGRSTMRSRSHGTLSPCSATGTPSACCAA